MFYFLRRTILCASPTQKLQCLQQYTSIVSLRYASSNANEHSFTVSYLKNSCGLSSESAVSASKYVNFENPEIPDSVLHFFRNHGFSKSQIANLIKRCPKVLLCSPVKTLLPKLEFFRSKGISDPDIVKILSVCPRFFRRSLKNHIIPNFNSLSKLFQSSENAVALAKRFPLLLLHDLEDFLLPNVKILRDSGVPASNILKFIHSWPSVGLYCPNFFEKNVAAVKEMGINPLRSQFLVAVTAKNVSESLWKRKFDVYKKWGWSDEEFLAAFAKQPWCMIASTDKIKAVMEFFVNKMGWESSVLAKYPTLITLSLEKRIIPRTAVIKFLLSKGLVKTDITYLVTLLLYPEKTFVQRFINSYDEARQLLKLYKEKLDPPRKTKSSI